MLSAICLFFSFSMLLNRIFLIVSVSSTFWTRLLFNSYSVGMIKGLEKHYAIGQASAGTIHLLPELYSSPTFLCIFLNKCRFLLFATLSFSNSLMYSRLIWYKYSNFWRVLFYSLRAGSFIWFFKYSFYSSVYTNFRESSSS